MKVLSEGTVSQDFDTDDKYTNGSTAIILHIGKDVNNGFFDAGSTLSANMNNISNQLAPGASDTSGAPLGCEYFHVFFQKNLNVANGIIGAWGKMFRKEN
jgi:hypothetical protein